MTESIDFELDMDFSGRLSKKPWHRLPGRDCGVSGSTGRSSQAGMPVPLQDTEVSFLNGAAQQRRTDLRLEE